MWLPEKVKIVEMPENRAEGGYGEIRRVRIAKMAGIPTLILQKKIANFEVGHQKQVFDEYSSTFKFSCEQYVDISILVS